MTVRSILFLIFSLTLISCGQSDDAEPAVEDGVAITENAQVQGRGEGFGVKRFTREPRVVKLGTCPSRQAP